jgi:hypothetical protein
MTDEGFEDAHWGGEPDEAPAPVRPTVLTVIAILSWVLGGFALSCLPFGLVASAFPELFQMGGAAANPMVGVFEQNPWMKPLFIVQNLLALPVYGVLLAGAFGLWKMRRWGWTLCNLFAVAEILRTVLTVLLNVVFVYPAMLENLPSNPGARGGAIGGVIGGACGALFWVLLPVVLLVLINFGAGGRAKPPKGD